MLLEPMPDMGWFGVPWHVKLKTSKVLNPPQVSVVLPEQDWEQLFASTSAA
jgi:hypothetical protein